MARIKTCMFIIFTKFTNGNDRNSHELYKFLRQQPEMVTDLKKNDEG